MCEDITGYLRTLSDIKAVSLLKNALYPPINPTKFPNHVSYDLIIQLSSTERILKIIFFIFIECHFFLLCRLKLKIKFNIEWNLLSEEQSSYLDVSIEHCIFHVGRLKRVQTYTEWHWKMMMRLSFVSFCSYPFKEFKVFCLKSFSVETFWTEEVSL